MSRNYKKEYDNYHASADQRKKRSSRNKARRKMTKSVERANYVAKMLTTGMEILLITVEGI
jgi:hypothetical protein